jgi:hypothetical protein
MAAERVFFGTFVVTGRNAFPVDMLRYDHCWPESGRDSALIEASQVEGPEPRTVRLRGWSSDFPVTPSKRWASYGWTPEVR